MLMLPLPHFLPTISQYLTLHTPRHSHAIQTYIRRKGKGPGRGISFQAISPLDKDLCTSRSLWNDFHLKAFRVFIDGLPLSRLISNKYLPHPNSKSKFNDNINYTIINSYSFA